VPGDQARASPPRLAFVAGGYSLVVTDRCGGLPAALRLLAKLVAIDV